MSEVFEWTKHHGFLAWCALWLFWGLFWLVAVSFNIGFKLFNRVLRTIKVCVRGWPPAHLDADGDWRTEPKRPEVKGISEAAIGKQGADATTNASVP